jgi:hypothetical protein
MNQTRSSDKQPATKDGVVNEGLIHSEVGNDVTCLLVCHFRRLILLLDKEHLPFGK